MIVLLLISGYIQNIGAIDKVSTQWLYFSIINLIISTYLIFTHKSESSDYKVIIYSPITILFSLFLVWGLCSYFYSINPNEVIVKSIRWFNCFIGFINLVGLLKKLEKPIFTISVIISMLLGLEISNVYFQYFEIIQLQKYDFSKAYMLQGLTGNKNIASASIIVKLPFLLYLIYISQNSFFKFILSVVSFSTFYILIILSARATYISIVCSLIFIILFSLVKYFKNSEKRFLKFSVYPLTSFSIAILFTVFSLGINNSASIGSRIQTINYEDTSTLQRLRYYNHALEHIKNNPILGTGLGNWKIKSIDYDSKNIEGYIVPYHAHNDFLEITAELGLVGFALFFGIFFIVGIDRIKNLFFSLNFDFFSLFLLLSLGSYFIDSNLNFPHARVINQINFIAVISSFLILKQEEK